MAPDPKCHFPAQQCIVVGGGLGGQILGLLLGDPNVGEAVAGAGGIGSVLTDVAGGGVGGGVVLAIVGFIRNKIA